MSSRDRNVMVIVCFIVVILHTILIGCGLYIRLHNYPQSINTCRDCLVIIMIEMVGFATYMKFNKSGIVNIFHLISNLFVFASAIFFAFLVFLP